MITKAIGWVGNLVKQYNFEKIEGAWVGCKAEKLSIYLLKSTY